MWKRLAIETAVLVMVFAVASVLAFGSEAATDALAAPTQVNAPPVNETASAEREPTLDERLDALLTEALPENEYREAQNCLRRHEYREGDILSQEYLLFSRNGRYWLNKLQVRCPSLNRNVVLTFNSSGTSSVCRSQPVYVADRFDISRGFDSMGRPNVTRGICRLGEFEVISVEQAAILQSME